jgi:sRNA-binding carbon storage regulator CsrA
MKKEKKMVELIGVNFPRMLSLTIKNKDDYIKIGENIYIYAIKKRGYINIGIDAPKDIIVVTRKNDVKTSK